MRHVDAHTKPETDDDLHEYVAAYMGYKIPKAAVCRGHVAPFTAIADLFFERETNAVLFASRGSGKTLNMAMLHCLNMVHKPMYEIASVGAIENQAMKCYEYFLALNDKPWFVEDKTRSMVKETKYRNGSTLRILPGTLAAVNGPHPNCAVFDEFELMPWNVLQDGFSMACSTHGYQKAQILTSTRKFPAGPMQRALNKIKEGDARWPFRIYTWCVFEAAEKCHYPSCEHCKEIKRINRENQLESWHDICHEEPENHSLGKCRASNGFMKLTDIWENFATQDWDKFDSQWRCLKPGRQGLVFPSFDEEVHCHPDLVNDWRGRLFADAQRAPVKRELEICITIDMGWADPLAVLFTAKDRRDNLFLFDCIYETGLDLRDFAPILRRKMQAYRLPPDFVCHCDERSPREIDELNKLGIRTQAVGAPVDERIRMFRQFLDGNYRENQPTACIDPETCKDLIFELNTLHYKLDKDGQPRGELPDKGADHLIDCAGYMLEVYGLIGGMPTVQIFRFKDPPRPAVRTPTRRDWTKWR